MAKNVADDTAAREELIARTGRMAVPVITVDDEIMSALTEDGYSGSWASADRQSAA